MAELLSMVFDDDDDGCVTAMYAVGDCVLQLKQRPLEGREYNEDKEELQEYAMQHPEEAFHPSSANGEYDSAFPNVGLVIWQSGFVLADFLLRTLPRAQLRGMRLLELGCGTGQLGIALALAGADVTLTDLAHITPLTQENVDANAAGCAVRPRVAAYMWGTPAAGLAAAAATAAPPPPPQQQQQQHEEQQGEQADTQQDAGGCGDQQPRQGEGKQEQPPRFDLIVAADVLYEPQHYDELLDSLMQLCPWGHSDAPPHAAAGEAAAPASEQQQQQPGGGSGGAAASPPVFIAYRVRRYGEHGFEAKAASCGFTVAAVPTEELHADFRCGGYRIIRLDRTGPAVVDAGKR